MNTFLMWLGGLLISVLAALFAVPHFIDWNGYRGVFEEEASRVFGRDVRVGGAVNVRLLPTPYVRFEKLRIADTSGVTGAPLFQADSFTMWLSVSPLLKGAFEARQIELERPVVRLAVDRTGAPNWTELAVRPGRLPFVPNDVALNDVMITDGEIAYDAAGVGTLARVTAIEGSLSAQGLRGPFSFRGFAQFDKRLREVRLQTGDVTDEGTTKLKAVVQKPNGGSRHALEGDLAGLFDRPNFKGAITSNVKLASGQDAPEIDLRADVEATSASAKLVNLVASFENVGQPQIVTGEAGATWGERHRVQVDLSSRWLDLDRLSAPFGAGETADAGADAVVVPDPKTAKVMPLRTARNLFARLIEVLPDSADLQARLDIDQVNLGGDAVSNIKMVLSGVGGPLQMRSLTASLPGGTRFDFSGELIPDADGAAFDGNVFVGGPSLVRVVRWAVPDYGRLEQVSDGPFSLSGRLAVGTDVVALENGTAEFSRMPVRGRVHWQEKPVSKLALQLEGYQLDTRWVGIDQLRIADLMSLHKDGAKKGGPASVEGSSSDASLQSSGSVVVPGGEGAAGAVATPGSPDPEQVSVATAAVSEGPSGLAVLPHDVEISLRAGRLINGPSTLTDFDGKITVRDGQIGIEKLGFQTEDGMTLQAAGTVRAEAGKPKGRVRFTVASSANASASGSDSKGVPRLLADQGLISEDGQAGLVRALSGLAPYRLAGTLDVGARLAGGISGTVDGDIQGRHAAGQFQIDGGLESWRSAPVLLHLNLASDHTLRTMGLILAKMDAVGSHEDASASAKNIATISEASMPGTVVVQFRGTPDDEISWVGDVRGDQLDLTWSGRGRYSDQGLQLAEGKGEVKTAKASHLLALAGAEVGSSAGAADVTGRFTLSGQSVSGGQPASGGEAAAQSVKISSDDLRLSGIPLRGEIELAALDPAATSGDRSSRSKDQMLSITGRLSTQRLALADILDGVLGEAPVVAPAPRIAFGPSVLGRANDAAPYTSPDLAELYSDAFFDLGLLRSIVGSVEVRADRFAFDDGLYARDAQLTFDFDGAGAVKAKIASTKSAAGAVVANLTFAGPKGGAGAKLDGTLRLSDGRLERILGRAKTKAAGTGGAVLDAKFSGRGLTPRALMLALNGQGTVSLQKVTLNGLAPGQVADAAEALLSRPPDESIEGEAGPAVSEALGAGQLSLGSTKVPFRIRDGAVRFAEMAIRADGGTVRGITTMDLMSFSIDSAWKVVAASRFEGKPDWPVVDVVFVGPLTSLGSIEPQISSGALERELGVQRLERIALRLEELRAEDEARAEEARLRAAELERQREEEAALAREAAREEAARRAREDAIRRRAIREQNQWQPPAMDGPSQW
ncbi:MAG: AsmA family protein [Pseudomonadota bacterium]